MANLTFRPKLLIPAHDFYDNLAGLWHLVGQGRCARAAQLFPNADSEHWQQELKLVSATQALGFIPDKYLAVNDNLLVSWHVVPLQ